MCSKAKLQHWLSDEPMMIIIICHYFYYWRPTMWETHQHVSKISKHFLSLCGDVQSHVSSLVLTVFSLHRRQSRALLLTNMNADLWSLCPLQPPSKGSQEGQPVLVPVQTLCWWKLPLPPSHQPPHSSEILSVCHTVTHIHTTQRTHGAAKQNLVTIWGGDRENIPGLTAGGH